MSMRNERPVLSERRESNGPDPIDALIDDAARQLVAGEPSSALRGAVRERIERRRSAWSLVPAFAGGAALLIVTGMIVGRTLSGPPGGPDKAPTVDRAQSSPAAQPPPLVVEPARTRERVQFTRRLAAAAVAPPQEEELPIPPIAIEPLATEPLGPVQIAVDVSSGVMPIEIEPLQIEPLRGSD
jgi:hypothetical protein